MAREIAAWMRGSGLHEDGVARSGFIREDRPRTNPHEQESLMTHEHRAAIIGLGAVGQRFLDGL